MRLINNAHLLESSVVLTLIQDIVNKIRTSDLSGQMHYLSNWYKQSQSENDSNSKMNDSGEKNRSKSDGSPTTSAVKRTSSGRIVRQRVDLTLYNNKGDEEDKEKEKNASQQKSETNISPKPRPTSLNPFRIPVTLLNFKDTRSTLVADKPNSSAPR